MNFSGNPVALAIAIALGVIPAILWLSFWLREEDHGREEPLGLIALTFLAGMLAVLFVLPIEKFIGSLTKDNVTLITLWATSEEIIKYLAFVVIMYKSQYIDRPVDYAIYLMTAALGFAALENTLYLIRPGIMTDTTVAFLTGSMRFLGSTLLHSVASGIIGIGVGLAYFKGKEARQLFGFIGLISAVALHSVFNFFIMQKNGENFLQVFGFLWVITIIIMLLFERLRRMGSYADPADDQYSDYTNSDYAKTGKKAINF